MLSGLRCASAAFAAGGRVVAAAHDDSGTRVVTANEHHELRVVERAGDGWRSCVSWKAHDAAVCGVAWASSVFGQILASCAADGSVKVWLILPAGEAKLLAALGGDRAAAVAGVAFAPQHHGLVLAVAGVDGVVRLYESADGGGAWDEQGQFEAGAPCTALAWCLHGAARPPTLAVGVAGSVARVWAFDAEQRRWIAACALPGVSVSGLSWARNDGRPWELLAGFSGASVLLWRVTFANGASATAEPAAQPFVHGGSVCSVDWDFTGTRLAVAALDGRVRLWAANMLGEWGEYAA